MKTIQYILTISLILIIDGCKPPEIEPSVQGIVIKTIDTITKKPLEGITVAVTSANLNDSKTTGSDGFARWESTAIGEYIITISSNDYKTQKKVINVAAEGKPSENTFALELAPMLEVNPASLNFSIDKKSEKVYFKNKSATDDITLNIEGFDDWLTVNNPTITIPAKQQKDVTFSVDIKGLSYGQKSTKVILNYRLKNVSDNTDFTAQFNYNNPEDPVVETNVPTGITKNSADITGNILKLNGSSVSQKGICWSENLVPNANSDPTATVSGGGLGNYTLTANNLKESKTYYARAFVKTTSGTSPIYGNTVEFITSATQTSPTVILNPVTNISQTTAVISGKISNNGGTSVTEQGFIYNTKGNPKITEPSDTKVIANVDANGSFSANLTGLNQGIVYYFKAYAINNLGATNAGYSNEIILKTQIPAQPIKLTTSAPSASNITETSALLRGLISEDGGEIKQHGFVWSRQNSNPEINNSEKNQLGVKQGAGSFTSTINNLKKGTLYYFRAYATNNDGQTFYGNAQTLITKETGLVLYYPFNGDASDASGNSNNAISTAKLTDDRFGNEKSSYDLSSGTIQVQNREIGRFDGDFTYSFKINISSSSFKGEQKVLFSKGPKYYNGNNIHCLNDRFWSGYMFYMDTQNETLSLYIVGFDRQKANLALLSSNSVQNEWKHITISKIGTSLKVYVDGSLQKEVKVSITNTFGALNDISGQFAYGLPNQPATEGSLTISGFSEETGCSNLPKKAIAYIDDFRIYSYGLSEIEVEELFKR